MSEVWDVIIVGGGPAGLTASIYATRYSLKTLVLATVYGGVMSEAHKICNYPSWPEVTGPELTAKFKDHATASGAKLELDTVEEISKENELFKVKTQLGKEYLGKTLILTMGMKHRKLGVAGEEKFLGKGVSYCFTCDGAFFKQKKVAVIGGGDGAVTAALYFADISPEVYLIYRGESLRAEPAWIESVKKKSNIKVLYNTNVVELKGEEVLSQIVLDQEFEGKKELEVAGLFIEIGGEPSRKLTQMLGVEIDQEGYVQVDAWGKTNIPGVWAAGDLTASSKGFRQIITACSQGAISVRNIFGSLQKKGN